jgi:hypothetical protein
LPRTFGRNQWTTNTDFHARKILRSDMLGNGADTVVSTGTAFTHHLDPTGTEINIVMQNKEIFSRYFKIVGKTADALTGTVHVGLRLYEKKVGTKGVPLTVEPLHFQGLCLQPLNAGEIINKEKTDVVPGQMVFPAGITEADEQKSRIRHGCKRKKNKKRAERIFRLVGDTNSSRISAFVHKKGYY